MSEHFKNIIPEKTALALAIEVKEGTKKKSDLGYAVLDKIKDYIELSALELKNRLAVREAVEKERRERPWGFTGPTQKHTPVCYDPYYRKWVARVGVDSDKNKAALRAMHRKRKAA